MLKTRPAPLVQVGYIATFKGKRYELYARNKEEAKALAASHFKARKIQHKQIVVHLADANWSAII